MKKLRCCFISALFFTLLFSILSAHAQDVDFSKSYVVPDKSALNTLTIGGITTLRDNATYVVNFGLSPDYNLILQGGLAQTSPSEVLEQQLRNSTWQGIYSVYDYHYSTTLTLIVVQDGYVGGEITHETQEQGGGLSTQ
jgi:hypothetical protein